MIPVCKVFDERFKFCVRRCIKVDHVSDSIAKLENAGETLVKFYSLKFFIADFIKILNKLSEAFAPVIFRSFKTIIPVKVFEIKIIAALRSIEWRVICVIKIAGARI